MPAAIYTYQEVDPNFIAAMDPRHPETQSHDDGRLLIPAVPAPSAACPWILDWQLANRDQNLELDHPPPPSSEPDLFPPSIPNEQRQQQKTSGLGPAGQEPAKTRRNPSRILRLSLGFLPFLSPLTPSQNPPAAAATMPGLQSGRVSPASLAGSNFAFPGRPDNVADPDGDKRQSSCEQQVGRHRRLFGRNANQEEQRQKQGHRPSSSKSHIANYLRGRATPDGDSPGGRRSLDSFAERQRRKQQQQQQHEKSTRRSSLRLPIMSNSTAPVTQTEFDALPQTVQRKYFSSLERLRFSSSQDLDSTPDLNHADPLRSYPVNNNFRSPAPRSRFTRHSRLVSDFVTNGLGPDAFCRQNAIPADFYAQLPEKIQRRHLTSEEQVIIAKHMRRRFILDPPDEVVHGRRCFKAEARNNINHSSQTLTIPQRPRSAGSMTTRANSIVLGDDRPSRNSIYDSFRWLEHDEELDLRLYLDDYHANLRDELPLDPKGHRPTFRRHVSVNKLPFGRSSVSLHRPPTREGVNPAIMVPLPATTPSPPPLTISYPAPVLARRRSRTLSLITPRNTSQEQMPHVDAPAAHYQDPEARLKLRAYLASPQKFDEAIEFGFPSTEAPNSRTDLIATAGRSSRISTRMGPRNNDGDCMQTFLADDRSSTYSFEDLSMTDPESPKTPKTEECHKLPLMARPPRSMTDPVISCCRPSDEYSHTRASSREMTLRMTLTRPDLRADEQQMYGWRKPTHRRTNTSPLRDGMRSPSPILSEPISKDVIQKRFDALDQEDQEEEKGVIKRVWKRVRRH